MKKLFALLAVVLAVASCQKESNDLAVNLGEQETLITVALPEATRANSANSAVGALDNNVLENYDLRFILEIYQGNKCYRMESIGQETEATFPVRVVQGHEYDFVVWADFVAKDAVELAENDIFYNTNEGDCGLQNITILNNAAMTEARDAYYGVAHLDADKAVSTISNITLTRPFAKVRVITTDLSDCIEKLGLQPSTATVTYTTETYDKFDARNKNVWSVNSNDNVKSINYDPSTRVYSEDNLFVDYILVPQGTQSTVKFDLNVTDVINRSFNTDIAVEANKITTIKGNILTNGSDIKVEVKDDFVSETIYLEGDVTLTEDLVIDRPMVVRDDATAVLNLNGHKIINTTGTADYESEGIIVYGNLTINDETGEGLIEANSRAIWARGNYGATITINGGNYVGAHLNTEVIYASGNGQIEINDGTFEAKKVSTGHGSANNRQHIILNLHNNGNDGCNIVVKGGSYKNFDPANNIAENPVKNFCAEGYVSVANGEWFDVVEGVKITSKEDLLNVLNNTTTTNIFFNADINMGTSNISANRDLNIDMQGYKYYSYSGNGVGKYAFYTNTKNITIDNANMEGDGFNVLGGSLTFNGGDFKLKASKNGRNAFYVAAYPTEETAILTINGGNFDIDRVHQDRVRYISAQGNAIVYIKGGNFGAPGEAGYEPIATSGVQGVDGQVIITGGTFGFDPSQWVADGYQAVQNGTTWTVSKE